MDDDTIPPPDPDPEPNLLGVTGETLRRAHEDEPRALFAGVGTRPSWATAAAGRPEWSKKNAFIDASNIGASYTGLDAAATSISKMAAKLVDAHTVLDQSAFDKAMPRWADETFSSKVLPGFARSEPLFPMITAGDVGGPSAAARIVTPDLEPMRKVIDEILSAPKPEFEIAESSRDTAEAVRDLLGVAQAERDALTALTGAVFQLVDAQAEEAQRQRERDAAASRSARQNTRLTIVAVVLGALGLVVGAVSAYVSVLAYRHSTSTRPGPPAVVQIPLSPPSTTAPSAPSTTTTPPAGQQLPTPTPTLPG